jgi:hypothetical protein
MWLNSWLNSFVKYIKGDVLVADFNKRKMKRKYQSNIDEYVMIKCQRFIFAPKLNKVINFWYEFENESTESENEDGTVSGLDGTVPAVVPSDGDEFKECELVIGLVEESDSVLTPAASSEALAAASEKLQIVDSCSLVVEPPERPKTPQQNPSTVSDPDSPDENRMLRRLKISDGRSYMVEKAKFIEFIRCKSAVEEEKKLLRQQWEELEARVNIMARIEMEMKSQLEDHFNARVHGMIGEMMRVEEIYKMELARERDMRIQIEGKMNEMAAFIDMNHQQMINNQQNGNVIFNHLQSDALLLHQQRQQQQQEALEFESRRREAIEAQQQAERLRLAHQQQHLDIDYGPKFCLVKEDRPQELDWLGRPISRIQQMEMKELEIQQRQRAEHDKQRLEAERQQQQIEMKRQTNQLALRKVEEQRRLEMRKMRQVDEVEQKVGETNDKVKEEQNRLYAIQEEKRKSSFDPFALLKKVPNVFGWKNPNPPAVQKEVAGIEGRVAAVATFQNGSSWPNVTQFGSDRSCNPSDPSRPSEPKNQPPLTLIRPSGNNMETDQRGQLTSTATGTTLKGSPSKSKIELSNFCR